MLRSYKAFQELKDISRVCPCKYRDLGAKVPYKTSKFQRLSAIATVPTAWRDSYRAHTLKSHDFMPRYLYGGQILKWDIAETSTASPYLNPSNTQYRIIEKHIEHFL
jgi:hypothetical protein